MLIIILILVVLVVAFVRPLRYWLLEELKELSDRLLLLFLQATSSFGRELTKDGETEQQLWREQRLRNIRGLALRARQRFEKSQP
jgi:hypothetical protein